MNVDKFAQQIQDIHGRLDRMYRASTSVHPQPDLLPVAFKELGIASEELQVASEELLQQTEELAVTRGQLEAERERYKDLFEFMPNAYLVTDAHGKIQEANRAAAALFNIEQSYLMGKLLVNFIPPQERSAFRSKLNHLQQYDWVQEWTVNLQPRKDEIFEASLTASAVRESDSNLVTLRWIVRDVTKHKRTLKVLATSDGDSMQERARHFYCKGEIIPLESQMIWLVRHGLVKLSTMSETGDEVLIGLIGGSMPFGSSLTSLPTYQATALSENVELVGISLPEIAASPRLAQDILPKISDRLRQTESLLALSGKRHVKERLYHLLQWLKQEVGQPIAQGTRLKVRLTHQDLADACCTTRVTITRLLGKLQQEGVIAIDSQNHICLIDERFQKCS